MTKAAFKGMIFGVAYADRQEFEKAARAAGWRSGMSNRTGDWKVGLPVAVTIDRGPVVIHGQVWSKGADKGAVIVALEDGRYAWMSTSSGSGLIITARGERTDQSVRVLDRTVRR